MISRRQHTLRRVRGCSNLGKDHAQVTLPEIRDSDLSSASVAHQRVIENPHHPIQYTRTEAFDTQSTTRDRADDCNAIIMFKNDTNENWNRSVPKTNKPGLLSPHGYSSNSQAKKPLPVSWRGIDISTAQRMFVVCQEDHVGPCSPNQLYEISDKASNILLVDVLEGCLQISNLTAKYITLSYIWGGAKQLKTTRANFQQFCKPGGLLPYWNQIPRVIKDAIEVIKILGQRFLWVDCLSIIQDDYTAKHNSIRMMGQIYHSAQLTIVALSGRSADDGLNAPFRGKVTQYHSSDFVQTHLKKLILDSPYYQRGWTFQERLLSRRCLFFHDSHQSPFYSCYQTLDFNGKRGLMETEDHRIINPLIALKVMNQLPPNDMSPKFERSNHSGNDAVFFDLYDQIVTEYTSKSLSYASDVLNAFVGVFRVVFSPVGWDSILGLPSNYLSFGLLWTFSSGTLGPQKRRDLHFEIPSWTWAGWHGKVTYDILWGYKLLQLGHHTELKTCVNSFYIFHTSSPRISIEATTVHCLKQSNIRITGLPSRAARIESFLHKEPKEPLDSDIIFDQFLRLNFPHALCFQAQCLATTKFYFKSCTPLPCYRQESDVRNEQIPATRILDDTAEYCGFLHGLDIRRLELLPTASPKYFVLISETLSKEESILNVLYVQSMGQYMERLAMGTLNPNTWHTAKPETRWVILN